LPASLRISSANSIRATATIGDFNLDRPENREIATNLRGSFFEDIFRSNLNLPPGQDLLAAQETVHALFGAPTLTDSTAQGTTAKPAQTGIPEVFAAQISTVQTAGSTLADQPPPTPPDQQSQPDRQQPPPPDRRQAPEQPPPFRHRQQDVPIQQPLEAVANLIQNEGTDARQAIARAVRDNHITFIGERHSHFNQPELHRALVASAMADLPPGTRIAVEYATALQPFFDMVNQSPRATPFTIPPANHAVFQGEYGSQARDLLLDLQQTEPVQFAMWQAAHAAGHSLHAIDNNEATFLPPGPRQASFQARRDELMAQELLALTGMSQNRHGVPDEQHILFYGGLAHSSRTPTFGHITAAQLVLADEHFQQAGGTIATFATQTPTDSWVTADGAPFRFTNLTQRVSRPTSVPTRNANGQRNALGQTQIGFGDPASNLGLFDYVIFLPQPQQ